MAVETLVKPLAYDGDGSQTDFIAPKVLDGAHLVIHLKAADGAFTLQTAGVDYTLIGSASAGYTVRFTTAPAVGVTVVISRETPALQPARFKDLGRFPASATENAFDRLVYVLQDIFDRLERTPHLAPGEDPLLELTREQWNGKLRVPQADGSWLFLSTTDIEEIGKRIEEIDALVERAPSLDVIAEDLTGPDTIGAAAAFLGAGSPGFMIVAGPGNAAVRSFSVGFGLSVLNADGVQGNPQFAISNANLVAEGGLNGAANKIGYFTGPGQKGLADFTATGRLLAGASSAATGRDVLGVGAVGVLNEIAEANLSDAVQEKLNRSAKNNYTATTDPTADDDAGDGYSPGSTWINRTTKEAFRCVVATEGAAEWIETTLTTDELGTLAQQNANAVNITGGTGAFDTGSLGGVAYGLGLIAGRDLAADGDRLDGMEDGATADQTGEEIRDLYEALNNRNAFTDALLNKLNGIAPGANVVSQNLLDYDGLFTFPAARPSEASFEVTLADGTRQFQAVASLGGGDVVAANAGSEYAGAASAFRGNVGAAAVGEGNQFQGLQAFQNGIYLTGQNQGQVASLDGKTGLIGNLVSDNGWKSRQAGHGHVLTLEGGALGVSVTSAAASAASEAVTLVEILSASASNPILNRGQNDARYTRPGVAYQWTAGQDFRALNNRVFVDDAQGVDSEGGDMRVSWELYQNNPLGGAYATYHINGVFAAHMGLHPGKGFCVGGWSFGENSYRILHEGNLDQTDVQAALQNRVLSAVQKRPEDFYEALDGDDWAPAFGRLETWRRAQGADGQRRVDLGLSKRVYLVDDPVVFQVGVNDSLFLQGCGPSLDGSRITPSASWTGGAGVPVVDIVGDNGQQTTGYFDIQGVAIVQDGESVSGGPADAALRVRNLGAGISPSQITEVYAQGFQYGYTVENSRRIKFDHCDSWGRSIPNAAPFRAIGDGSGIFCGDLDFEHCQGVSGVPGTYLSPNGSTGILIDARPGAEVRGIRFRNHVDYHSDIPITILAQADGSAGGQVADIWINPSCQFDQFVVAPWKIEAQNSGANYGSIFDIWMLYSYWSTIIGSHQTALIEGSRLDAPNQININSGLVANLNILGCGIPNFTRNLFFENVVDLTYRNNSHYGWGSSGAPLDAITVLQNCHNVGMGGNSARARQGAIEFATIVTGGSNVNIEPWIGETTAVRDFGLVAQKPLVGRARFMSPSSYPTYADSTAAAAGGLSPGETFITPTGLFGMVRPS